MTPVVKHTVCLLGGASIAYGSWLIYHPAGFILGGCMLVLISLVIDKATERGNRQ